MKKYSTVVLCFSFLLFASCEQKPFVEHSLKYSKQASDCESLSARFKMISNFGGERFEFTKCLPATFDGKLLEVKRMGDTVVISFPQQADNKAVFNITLDIDSYPRYNFITIDDETYGLSHSAN